MKLKTVQRLLDCRIIWAVSIIIVIVLMCFDVAHADPRNCNNRKNFILQNPKDGVCGTVDIRNNVTNFRKLENCTVIEGNVHILLIDESPQSKEFDKYSFPLLTEITGHLMLFRVRGLRSLKNIFPNLAIIRGQDLFYNYALVAYEIRDLEEIGLINLRTIVRGGVRITKNKKLCYVDTVDWSRIAIGTESSELHFMDNKEKESQLCANYCPDNCHASTVDNVAAKRCWTSQHCQKNLQECRCPHNAPCMENGTCCNKLCLGGCTGPGTGNCLGCKGVLYQNNCEPRCPPNTFMFSETRCLDDKECLGLRNRTWNGGKKMSRLLIAREKNEVNKCVVGDCPNGYMVTEEGNFKGLECVKCKDFCPKVCNSTEVNSIQDLQRLKGCSKIIGPLVIQIMGGSSVAYEMEKNLGDIKEVTGYINIRRSFALLHLYFFKKLEVIGGETLAHQGHSLIVMDNVNLQELFLEGQKIKIKRGKVAFHTNRRLCLYKIRQFVQSLNLTEKPTDQDISEATNGDLKPCVEHHMNLTLSKISHDSAVLYWEKDVQDNRQLLTYNINYKEVPKDEENINILLGRDACSDNVWMNREQPPTENNESFQLGLMPHLKPNTKYAAYVQALTLTSATHSAITNLITFSTKPYYPTEPLDVQVIPTHLSTELHVKWKPPKHPNGKVTHYRLVYMKLPLNVLSFDQRDYCLNPIIKSKDKSMERVEKEEKKFNVSSNCCQCPKSKKELEKEGDKRKMDNFFENHLQNNVYCKRYDTLPKDIDIGYINERWNEMNKDENKENQFMAMDRLSAQSINNSYEDHAKKKDMFDNTHKGNMDVYNFTETVIPELEPFTEYTIELQACQDTDVEMGINTKLCSNRAITVGRTKAEWINDRINESTIVVEMVTNTTGDVIIKWASPPKPSGLILKYNLRYKRANQENLVATQVCINRKKYKVLNGYHLTGLEPGNWTYDINAVSLAGNSSYTEKRYFVIPQPEGESNQTKIFVVSVVLALLLLLLIGIMVVCVIVKHKFHPNDMTVVSQNMNYLASSDLIDTMDGWEVDRDKIKILQELGKGSFGMVYKGIAKGIGDDPDEEMWVAVKTVNDRANFFDRREFLKEATTMKAFDCHHVVKLLGVVSTGQPALVIMELMAKDLKNYLREHRPDELQPGMSPPRVQDILQMAGEIADGMAYLADKKFVHRDLAARNCMVAEDSTVKIGDFGMARDIYETDYYRKGGRGMLPVRWMAPESLRDGVFSTVSDVWSFGVVIWEMVTLAAQPYQGLSNEEVVKFISDGNTMAVPDQCPKQMEDLMMKCWKWRMKDRPAFIEIIKFLEPYLNAKFKQVSFYYSNMGHRPHGDGGGGGEGGGAIGSPHDPVNKGADSLNRKGAAALLPSHQDYDYQSSPHSGDENFCSNSLFRDSDGFLGQDVNSFSHHHHKGSLGSYGDVKDGEGSSLQDDSYEDVTEGNDLRCFMGEEYQSVPSGMPTSLSNPSSLRESSISGVNHPSLPNQGLFELQPLICKDSPAPSSASPHNLPSPNSNVQPSQATHVSPSDYIGFDPVHNGADKNTNAPNYNSQLSHQNNEPVVLPLTATAAVPDRPTAARSRLAASGQPSWPSGSTSASTASSSQPLLRLPVLNQPPGGSFRRSAQTTDLGDSRNSSSRNLPSVQNSPNLPVIINPANTEQHSFVNEQDTPPVFSSSNQPSSSSSFSLPSPPPPSSSAIDSVSSDGSKESTKSSGSHSQMNGLTNGHALSSSSMQQRTALC